jgi:hypothetical protein
MAAPSLNVNGMEHAALNNLLNRDAVDIEPYDRRLHEKLQGMYETLEKETLEVSRLRREAGPAAATNFKNDWEKEIQEMEAALQFDGRSEDALVVVPLERQQNVEKDYQRGLETLQTLKNVWRH